MTSTPQNPPKKELIEISEEIVDLGEVLENADPQTEAHRIQKAVRSLRETGDRLLDLEPNHEGDDLAFIQFMLGSVCQLLGYHERAVETYDKALKYWPEHVGILNELFLSLSEIGDYERAADVIQKSIKCGGETPDVLQNFAVTLVHLDRLAEAKTVLFNCISKFPGDQESEALLRQLDAQSVTR